MKHKFTVGLTLLVMVGIVLGVYACESSNDGSVSTTTATDAPRTATVGVKVNLNAKSSTILANALGSSGEIVSITVNALDFSDASVLSTTTLQNNAGIWEGALEQVPYGININFTATARNSTGIAIFSGTLTKILIEGVDNNITINLLSIDDGVDPVDPVITSVSLPQTVLVDSEPQLVSFQISHSTDVQYTIKVTGGSIAAAFGDTPVSSLSGVHNPAGSLDIFFKAPSVPGVAQLTIAVKETGASDEVGASFYINVISFDPDTWTDSGVFVVIGPAITDMAFNRSETTLKVTVATDPASGLTYSWTGTGDFATLNKAGNPIFVTGFNDTLAGSITVTATNANNLTAFITRNIQAGDFPYLINDYIADMPGLLIFDETTRLLWQDNTNKIKRKWSDANSYCTALDLAGYAIWQLPIRNELSSMFDRKADFSNVEADEYWSGDEDPTDSDRAFTISFADNSETSQSKNHKKLVRCVKD